MDRFYVVPSVQVSETYDSNVNNEEDDVRDDLSTQLNPAIALRRENDRSLTEAELSLNQRLHREFTNENGLDRKARLRYEHSVTRRFRVNFDGTKSFFEGQDPFDDGSLQLSGGSPDLDTTELNAGWRYALTPRNALRFDAGLSTWDYGGTESADEERRDVDGRDVSLSLIRQWSDYDTSGLTLSYVHNDFAATSDDSERQSKNLSLYGNWGHSWNSRWNTALTLGLRHLDSGSAESIVALDDPFTLDVDESIGFQDTVADDVTLGLVGALALRRTTDRSRSEFSLSRQTQPRSGFGTDQNVDALELSHWLRLTKRVSMSFGASWLRQKSTGDVLLRLRPTLFVITSEQRGFSCANKPGTRLMQTEQGQFCGFVTDQAIDGEVLALRAQFDYQLNERLRSFLRLDYQDQTSSGDDPLPVFNEHRILIGFRYSFDYDLL